MIQNRRSELRGVITVAAMTAVITVATLAA
jgi:hypothetical protein